MEIERKFTLKSLPDNLESYPSHHIEQVYLNYNPVVRARKQDDEYYLTYKGSGMMARDESNLPLNEASYYHLREKADGSVISKRRYLIPLEHPGFKEGFPTPPADYSLTIELDVFDAPFAPYQWSVHICGRYPLPSDLLFPQTHLPEKSLSYSWFSLAFRFVFCLICKSYTLTLHSYD